jgi:hypothetical protein
MAQRDQIDSDGVNGKGVALWFKGTDLGLAVPNVDGKIRGPQCFFKQFQYMGLWMMVVIDRDLRSRIMERHKKREAHDVIQVGVSEKPMDVGHVLRCNSLTESSNP